MEELCICKICKKVYKDVQGLNTHKMAQHPLKSTPQHPIQVYPFATSNSLSVSAIRKETNSAGAAHNSVIVMSHNQNSFRKASMSPSITVRRQEMKAKQQMMIDGNRMRVPGRPEPRNKNANAVVKQMVMGTAGVDLDADDGTSSSTTWQKWDPPQQRAVPSTTTGTIGNVKGASIITKSAAEMAASATVRKSIPPLNPIVPQGGVKRPGQKATPTPRLPNAGGNTNSGAVANIMQNLGKIKSMNNQPQRPPVVPKQKMISLPPPAKKGNIPMAAVRPIPQAKPGGQKPVAPPQPQSFRVNNKPAAAAAPKNKMVPKNPTSSNFMPKAAEVTPQRQQLEDMEMESSDPQDDESEPELQEQIQAPATGKPPGKAPPPSKSLNTHRFTPLESSPKKGKGKDAPSSPNGKAKSASGPAPSTSNGTNKQAGGSDAAGGDGAGAKKSAPEGGKGKKKRLDTMNKLKSYVPTMAGTDYDMPKLSAIGSYTNRAGQQVWVCLVCNQKESEESSQDMICCELCEDWYHWECVGIRQAPEEEDDWYCKRCIYQTVPNVKKVFPRIFKNDFFD